MVATDALLSILSSVIHGREINVGEDVDWGMVYEMSMEQAVPGVVFDEVQKRFQDSSFKIQVSLPTEVTLQWYAALSQIEKQNRKANLVLRKVAEELERNDIRFILLKGQGLAKLYPNNYSRHCGDIDIFVGTAKYDAAKKVFAEKGWLVGDGIHEDFKHLKCSVDGVLIEIHNYPIVLPGLGRNAYFQKWAAESLDCPMSGFFLNESGEFDSKGVFVATFPLSLNFVYTFIHAFFHFISEGLVLRQVVDFALLLKKVNVEKVNHSDFKMQLEKVGFLKPWQVFGCLLVKYFGFSVEEIPCYDARYDKKAEKVIAIILEEGRRGRKKKSGKWSEYIRQCGCHLRLFGLFPAECIGFLTRMVTNTALKYAKK